jgi:hypothetical protein
MKNAFRIGILSLLVSATAFAQPAALFKPDAKAATEVPVKVVVLFSSGVGYFEHIGSVTGDATTELRFKTHQINDILKSLVLQDTSGRVASVVYPSQDPLSKTLKSFQIDLSNNPPLADLLNQLRGAKVSLAAGAEKLSGTILGLEKKPKAVEKGQIEVWQLNVLTDATIRSLQLDDISKIEIQSPELQEELNKALWAIAQSRDQDKKPVTIKFIGQAERAVRIGYVVETPVWKTSYRLLMPVKPQDQAALQGWAIVENQTDNDWSDVQLSLVSGRPISFIQELYQPLYIPRPVVYPELFASLKPQSYEAGMDAAKRPARAELDAAEALGAKVADAPNNRAVMGRARSAGAAPAAPASTREKMLQELDRNIDITASVASVASASKIGELFQYTVANVSLPRQRSSMLPIITDPIEVEKVSIYNQSVLPKNPLTGARIKNTTTKHLLQGPVTVLEGSSYAGDARIDNVPPGQQRLLSYGIDLQMLVNASKNKQDSLIESGKIVKGVLNIQRRHVFTQEYVAENKDTKNKTLIVEHPFRQGWKLIEPEKAVETTENLYRFSLPVPAEKSASLTVKEQIVQGESIAILPADWSTLDFFAKNGEISKKVRDALAKAAALKQTMTEAQRQIDQLRNQINQLTQDENRLRENIKAVPAKSAQQTRLLEELDEQDKQIKGLYDQQKAGQKNLDSARKELEDYLKDLTLEE